MWVRGRRWSPTGIARGTLLHAPAGRHPGQTLAALIHGQSPWPSAAGVIVRYETATLQWKGFESRMAIWNKIYGQV
jgi:hypothetical protein